MMYLGIDYGKKRIGIAYSDASGTVSMPFEVVKNDKDALAEIMRMIKEKKAQKIVIGRSLDLKGGSNKIQKEIDGFKKTLKENLFEDILIEEENEFLTSAHVEVKNEMLDASAAALILQRYLDKERYKEEKNKIS